MRPLCSATLSLLLSLLVAPPGYGTEPRWPRTIEVPEGKMIVYQPQISTLKDISLTGRAAVAAIPKWSTEPFFGAVWFAARITTDRAARGVELERLFVTQVRFPGATKEQVGKLGAILKSEIPKQSTPVSLDRLIAGMDAQKQETTQADRLGTTPPRIIPASSETILITLDGEPVLRKVEGSAVLRVANTPFALFFVPGVNAYFLRGGGQWRQSREISGPWKIASSVPEDLKSPTLTRYLPADPIRPVGVESGSGSPRIVVATDPTELVEVRGEPELGLVDNTELFYVLNSENDIFLDPKGNDLYVLLSGRWFRAKSKLGPWGYVPSADLPEDFRKIPPSFERPEVLVSIFGNERAETARQDAFLPQTAAIRKDCPGPEVVYDGAPRFEDVNGTNIQIATNTVFDVLRTAEGHYCCDHGVWFEAPQPTGPWTIAQAIPESLHALPPECPLHHVKFARVYEATQDSIHVGYTPGYLGTYVIDGVIAYGTSLGSDRAGEAGTLARRMTYGFSAGYDETLRTWTYRKPYASLGWIPASPAESRGGTEQSAWWGPLGFLELRAELPLDASTSELALQTLPPEVNVYNLRPDRLAKPSWGRRLPDQSPAGQEPEPAPPFKEDDSSPEESPSDSDSSDARWEYLKRLAEAEEQSHQAQVAGSSSVGASYLQDDLYADAEGNVFWRNERGWKSVSPVTPEIDRSGEQDPRFRELDRHHSARHGRESRRERSSRGKGRAMRDPELEAAGFQDSHPNTIDPFPGKGGSGAFSW